MTPMALIRGEPIGMQLRYAAAMIFVSWIRILLINVMINATADQLLPTRGIEWIISK